MLTFSRGQALSRDAIRGLKRYVIKAGTAIHAARLLKISPQALTRALSGLPLYRPVYLRVLKAVDPQRAKKLAAAEAQ